MTYENYLKTGNSITKEEYVQRQKNIINAEILSEKTEKKYATYLCLAGSALSVFASYMLFGDQIPSYGLSEKVFMSLPTAAILFACGVIIRVQTKKIKKLEEKTVPLPTDEELEAYQLREYHLAETQRLGKKLEKKR